MSDLFFFSIIISVDAFRGIIHVYVPKTATKWSLQALIRSPVWNNANFGNDVSVDDERMVVAANAYRKSEQKCIYIHSSAYFIHFLFFS